MTCTLAEEFEHREKSRKRFLRYQAEKEKQEFEDSKLADTFFMVYYRMSKAKQKQVREIINNKKLV